MSQLLAIALTTLAVGLPVPTTAQRLTEQLDRETGVTVTSQGEPVAFARPQPQFSRSARDYLFLGPFEINRQGQRTYYLWVGVGTTLDRGYLAPQTPAPSTLYVSVNDEPVELSLHELADLGLGVKTVYATKVPLRAEYFARITLDQLRLFANAKFDEVVVKTDQPTVERYAEWGNKQPSWTTFINGVTSTETAGDAGR